MYKIGGILLKCDQSLASAGHEPIIARLRSESEFLMSQECVIWPHTDTPPGSETCDSGH